MLKAFGMLVIGGAACWAQGAPAAAPKVDRASAYYHYTLAHMYAELASNFGNRGEYVTRAIENYKLAIKADPLTPMLSEELSEIYIQAGRLREAQSDAEEALRLNPNDLSAHRMLARIFTRQIGEGGQAGRNAKINEDMVRRAIEQYQKISELDTKDTDSLVMLGRLYKVTANSVDAEKAFKKALDADPENEDALLNLALLYSDRGNNKEAADLLKKLADKNPTANSLMQLADAYAQMRDFGLAAETLQKVLEMNPQNEAEVRKALAQDQLLAERYQDALKTYQTLVADDPSDAESYLRISQIYRQLRDFSKAREASEKARGLEPNNLAVRLNEVNILEAEGKIPDGIKVLKEILSTTSKRTYTPTERNSRVTLLLQLAELQRSIDLTDGAVDSFRQVEQLDSTKAIQMSAEVIETYRTGRQLPKASQEAEAALKKWPQDRTVRLVHANLLAEMGNTDPAAAEIRKMFDGKSDRETWLALSQVYEKGHKFDEVAKALDQAEKLSGSQDEKIAVWFQRGAMYEKMKKIEPAEAEFRKILAVNPDHAGALNYLGYMLADRNLRLQEALALINKALEKEPGNGAYLDSLGWVYYRLGRIPEAEQNLREAVDRIPGDPTMRDHLGEVLMKASNVKEAVAQWETSLKLWEASSPADLEPAEVAKVKNKLENARVRLANETR